MKNATRPSQIKSKKLTTGFYLYY